jgi:phospholipid transport system substrate-binding protein
MKRRALWLVSAVLALAVAGAASAQTDPESAAQFVLRVRGELLAIPSTAASPDAVREQVGRVIVDSFALDAMTRTVLGARAAGATAQQRDRLGRALARGMSRDFLQVQPDAAQAGFALIDSRTIADGDWIVRTRIARNRDTSTIVTWRVRRGADGLRFVDALRDGVSLVITRRDEMAAALRASGDDLDAAIAAFERRSAGNP